MPVYSVLWEDIFTTIKHKLEISLGSGFQVYRAFHLELFPGQVSNLVDPTDASMGFATLYPSYKLTSKK
jgi:hypothetical protein